jgi:hypothetical protein
MIQLIDPDHYGDFVEDLADMHRLPAADRHPRRDFGQPGDLPVPVHGACVRARFAIPSSWWTCTTYSLPVSRRTRGKTRRRRVDALCIRAVRVETRVNRLARVA